MAPFTSQEIMTLEKLVKDVRLALEDLSKHMRKSVCVGAHSYISPLDFFLDRHRSEC